MLWVKRSPFHVAADNVPTLLFALDETVVMRLAHALMIVRINEQIPISAVRSAMVHDRCFGHGLGLEAALAQRLTR